MRHRQENLTVTLHWLTEAGEQTTTVVCEDSPPAQLLPLLLTGCGLPLHDEAGQTRPYALREGSADGRLLHHGTPVSAHGVRSGSHLWLTERNVALRRRCLVGLPDGSEATLPQSGAELTRAWLLQLMALLHPAAHESELERLARRESPFGYVSKRPHCAVTPSPTGDWTVATTRADVATLLNGARLFPDAPEPLRDGDRLTLGDYGPTLTISMLEG